jgi:hypothetical protein
VVPNCTPPTTSGNDSCVKLQVAPNNPHGTYTNSRLFARARTDFVNLGNCSAGGCWNTVALDFDNDFRLNLGSFPTCSVAKAKGNNQDIAAVWDACGPDAGSGGNAYLSTQVAPTGFGCTANPCVSGQATVNSAFGNFNACVLIFNGPLNANNQRTITLYGRAPITSAQCASNPASNHSGSQTVVISGTLTTSPLSGYGRRLTITSTSGFVRTPIDLYAYIKRGGAFQARCPSGASPWKLRGLFVFAGSGQANDVATSTQACS